MADMGLQPSAPARSWTGRLAPSPTGRLHIGNAYAALAAWLSARSRGGRLVLRIEDIDKPRCKPGFDTALMDDLRWLGLDWDGEPVWQSSRGELYDEALRTLRRKGLIYPCFCSRSELRAASAPHDEDGFFIYPGTCRRLSEQERQRRLDAGERHSWRLAMPDRDITVHDRIFGSHTFNLARDCGDVVLRRSDGIVAYQLAVTVDDMAQGVTDIVRGRDLLRSAAIQLWIRQCLESKASEDMAVDGGMADGTATDGKSAGDAAIATLAKLSSSKPSSVSTSSVSTFSVNLSSANPNLRRPTPADPSFAHLPLLDDPAGKRLAKRNKAIDLATLRECGVSPEAITGYCAWLLGIVDAPDPASPAELIAAYDESRIRGNLADRMIDLGTLQS